MWSSEFFISIFFKEKKSLCWIVISFASVKDRVGVWDTACMCMYVCEREREKRRGGNVYFYIQVD